MRDKLASVFAFRKTPTTVALVVVYAAIFLTLILTDDVATIPKPSRQRGLSLDDAYADLHQIAGLPHPYNSHQNDVVRDFILHRFNDIALKSDIVHVDDDRTTNVTFSLAVNTNNTRYGTYFESLNILVKVDGSKPDLPGVLLSAHFDSSPTAPGATDDGIATVTAIQLVDYFSRNRPKRTVVFNINDAEEDGLNGAMAYLEHPWSKLTDTFLNLEGAGAGGRPLLLRTSSTRLAKAFGKVSHPHGLISTADAFAAGVVKSSTDYSVYARGGLGGLDYTFYRKRSKYHTMEDTIPSLGGKSALWQMMESTLQISEALANDEKSSSRDASAPLYFDIFGEAFVVTTLHTFYIINILLLVFGLLLVGGLSYAAHRKGKLYWTRRGWGRAPVAFVVCSFVTLAFGKLYARVKPFAVYSAPASVLISLLALSLLCYSVTLEVFSYFRPLPQQRSAILLENFVFWWVLLVVDTVFIQNSKIGALYFFTFFYAGTLAALLVGLLEHFELPASLPTKGRRKAVNNVMNGAGDHTDERTPLLGQNGHTLKKEDVDEDNEIGLWLLQLLLSVPFPVILASQLAIVFLHALRQGLTDGTSPSSVYLGTAFFAVLIFMPMLPFAHKLHRGVTIVTVIVFACTTLYNVSIFPFSQNDPFRVFFQQKINLDTGVNEVMLTGVEPWVSDSIMPEVPSSWSKEAELTCGKLDVDFRAMLPYCSWHGPLPSVAPGNTSTWMSVNATKEAPGMGTISIHAPTSRGCRLYFDQDTPVTTMSVRGGSGRIQPDFPLPESGMWEAHLWSRTWDRTFDVSVLWADGEKPLKGRASCLWHDRAGVAAFEEVMAFLPSWVLVSNRGAGLLEGWKEFEIR